MQGGHAGKKIEQILSTMQVPCFCVTKIRAQAILPSRKKLLWPGKLPSLLEKIMVRPLVNSSTSEHNGNHSHERGLDI